MKPKQARFGAGALSLVACMLGIWSTLVLGSISSLATTGQFPLARLAIRNAGRNPARSVLTIGLVAAASFLIVAMSAFRLDPAAEGQGRTSGSGGYSLVAETSQPLYQDLNTPQGRVALGLDNEANGLLKQAQIMSLRVSAGDDASCLNLYQPQQPRMLGVSEAFIRRGGFAWAGSSGMTDEEAANPWLLLDRHANSGKVVAVPVVLDANTATYSLHLGGIVNTHPRDGRGAPLKMVVVGLLKNSIFQGDLLISENNLLSHFPDINGWRFFLVDTGFQPADSTGQARSRPWATKDSMRKSTLDRLSDFLMVQNTYLSTFQSLGGLGLLLGTLGIAVVQMRSVLERRGELALLRTGFARAHLRNL